MGEVRKVDGASSHIDEWIFSVQVELPQRREPVGALIRRKVGEHIPTMAMYEGEDLQVPRDEPEQSSDVLLVLRTGCLNASLPSGFRWVGISPEKADTVDIATPVPSDIAALRCGKEEVLDNGLVAFCLCLCDRPLLSVAGEEPR